MRVALKSYLIDYTWPKLAFLVVAAFIVRALTFGLYVQHEERYRQADTNDYHFCALGLKAGTGMHRIDTVQPIFWRTPGYPFYLSLFYRWYDIKTGYFSALQEPLKASIWVQIILCSFIPLLLFFLLRLLTGSLLISWIGSWIGVFHLGFVLASCYILSDALAQLFFIGFLYCFYKVCTLWFEPEIIEHNRYQIAAWLVSAAALLGIYTWIRPNGQFIVALSMALLLITKGSWQFKFSKIALFGLCFFAAIGGWYVRNYTLTNHWFFCPMSGPYLQSFSAPKIMRRVTKKPLDECLKSLLMQVSVRIQEETMRLAKEAPHLYVSKELLCKPIAMPWIINYPWYFAYEWIKEVLKTSFDLYASQLVAMVTKTHTYDPIEEFLTEKLSLCLYTQPMPRLMRIICWSEFIFSLLLWFGLLAGLLLFILKPLLQKNASPDVLRMQALWIKVGIIIGGMLIMTGGFGYARLRMPIDPLLWLLALTWWCYSTTKASHYFKRGMYAPTIATSNS